MICNKCGQAIPETSYYCEHCGEPINQTYAQQPFHTASGNNYQAGNTGTQQTYNQNTQNYQQYNSYNPYQQYTPEAFEYMINSKLEEARTFGIIAVIAGLFMPILGIVFGCIGISKLNEIPLPNQYNYEKELKKKKAKNLCIIGIVLPIILWILAVFFIVFVWGMLLSAL